MSVGTNRFGRASGLLVLCLLASACCAGDSSPPPRNPPAGGDVKEKGAAEGEGKGDGDAAIHAEPKGGTMAFTLQSSAFKEGDPIPAKYTGDGPDVSPALSWSDPPAGTRSFCLIADDPDAPVGLWSHWTLWNLPDSLRSLPEGVAKSKEGPSGSRQGMNDFHKPGYGGPAPPPGPAHRYFFRLYALDGTLDLPAGAARKELDKALKARKVLGTAELMGRYRRSR